MVFRQPLLMIGKQAKIKIIAILQELKAKMLIHIQLIQEINQKLQK